MEPKIFSHLYIRTTHISDTQNSLMPNCLPCASQVPVYCWLKKNLFIKRYFNWILFYCFSKLFTGLIIYHHTHTHTHTHIHTHFHSHIYIHQVCLHTQQYRYSTHIHTHNSIYMCGVFNKFPGFFVQAFRIVVEPRKFNMLLLYILWDKWPIFMI